MIVGGDRQRDENRGAAGSREFSDGRCSGATDEQVRVGEAARHVLEIGAQFGGDAVFGIALAHRFEVFGAALLGHLQAVAEIGRQHREAVGNDFRQHRSALAAASYKYTEQAVLGKRGVRLGAQREHFGAHRIAHKVRLAGILGVEPLDFLVRRRDGIDALGQEPVDPSEYCVLFVDHRGDLCRSRGKQSGQRGIAAEPDHARWLEALEQAQRHPPPFPDRLGRAQPAERAALEFSGPQPSRREDVHGQRLGLAGDRRAARIGDQRHVVPARFQFLRQRERGQDVASSAARGEHIMARSSTHRRKASPNGSGGRVASRVRNGLRRVIASRKPTPAHSAIIELPPYEISGKVIPFDGNS